LGGVPKEDCIDPRVYPIQLTYECLTQAIHVTERNIENGTWTPKEGVFYLSKNGVNKGIYQKVVEKAFGNYEYRMAYKNVDEEPEEWEDFNRENEKKTDKFSTYRVPSVWTRNIPLQLYIDTPMHLLYLGMVKTVCVYLSVYGPRDVVGNKLFN
jgi:hypothetical protein